MCYRKVFGRYPILIVATFFLVGFYSEGVQADEAPISAELALFGVSGPDGRTTVKLNAQQLAAFPQHTYALETPWTNGITEFTGPLLRDVLEAFGGTNVEDGELTLYALNDYSVSMPLSDAFENLPILAMQRDGIRMSIRDYGPYWLIYPWHREKRLRNDVYYARSVWMLKSISVSNGSNAQ
ncbi:hypothetical protein C9975_01235 [Thalassospira xiamenensis]|nr:hypothetical protein C9939_00970 [Pseudidiomarina aestuarii]PTC01583.1 hypothetical protein C9975_01235 [Thalassospira xiamenensis]